MDRTTRIAALASFAAIVLIAVGVVWPGDDLQQVPATVDGGRTEVASTSTGPENGPDVATAAAIPAAPVARTPEPGIERVATGLPADRSLPEGQIWPWDEGPMRAWIDAELARLDPLVTDPAHRTLAADRTLTPDSSRGFELAGVRPGLALMEAGDPGGLYILLSLAKVGDPRAFYVLAGFEPDDGRGRALVIDLHRAAADRDYLPALVNLSWEWSYGEQTPDTEARAAYLHYGFDLDGQEGGWPMLNLLMEYYIYEAPEGDPGDRLTAGIERLRDYGALALADYYLARARWNGIGMAQDDVAAVDAALSAAFGGEAHALNFLGMAARHGRGVAVDRELARDALAECVHLIEDGSCAFNLAGVYKTPSRGWEDYPLARALYLLSAELGPDYIDLVRGEVADLDALLDAERVARSDRYLEVLRNDDWSSLPHLGDWQPVPVTEMLAARTGGAPDTDMDAAPVAEDG